MWGATTTTTEGKKKTGDIFYRDTQQHKERHPLLLITLFAFFF
jgi:hypothetical protein